MLKLLYHAKIRNSLFQIGLVALVLYVGYIMFVNVQSNLSQQGISSGFDFLFERAGFSILWSILPYDENQNYLRVFLVGLTNTLLVSLLGIVFATVLGFVIGVCRLSHNWMLAKIALVYVEVIRNIPLLLQIFFWYFVVLRLAPHPRMASESLFSIFVTNRGVYIPWPHINPISLLFIFLSIIVVVCIALAKKKHKQTRFYWLILAIPLSLTFYLLDWQYPALKGFNFAGGAVLIPELISLWFALSIYTAAFIAEIIRAGILAIPKGQTEAALSLGLSKQQCMRKIIIPQALRVIIPPLTNQYLNLTKNSSLAAAIAYPELVSVFAGTALNQTGQAIEIIAMTMAVYLFISLSISLCMIIYERKISFK